MPALNAEDPSDYREVFELWVVVNDYVLLITTFMIGLTSASFFQAVATKSPHVNLEALAAPAALWIAARSSGQYYQRRGLPPIF